MAKKIKRREGPSSSAITRQASVPAVKRSAVEAKGEVDLAAWWPEAFLNDYSSRSPSGLDTSGELELLKLRAEASLRRYRETGAVDDHLVDMAEAGATREDVDPNVKAVSKKILAQGRAQREGKDKTTFVEAVQRSFTEPEVRGKRDVSLIRSSDGKVIADDEKITVEDGEHFRTVPNIKLGPDDVAPTFSPPGEEFIREDVVEDLREAQQRRRDDPKARVPNEGSAFRASLPLRDVDDLAAKSPALALSREMGWFGGAAPQAQSDYVDDAIDWYSTILTLIQKMAKGGVKAALPGFEEREHEVAGDARVVWPHLNSARVFAISPETYNAVFAWADRTVSEDVCDLEWHDPKTGRLKLDDASQKAAALAVKNAAELRPFPAQLPFDDTVIVYGAGVLLNNEQTAIHTNLPDETVSVMEESTLHAHLLTAAGECWEFLSAVRPDGQAAILFRKVRDGVKWERSLSLMAWVVPSIVDLVNSFKTLVREHPRGLKMRTEWEKKRREAERAFKVPGKRIPPPFYRVELKHDLVEEKLREHSKQHRTWTLQHRCDVRAHERVRYARGPLPMDPKLEAQLLKRGYKVFTAVAPPGDDPAWRILAERHERPKAPGEWLAIKVSWVKAHVRGPEGASYVPAVRTLPKNMETP